MSVLDELMSKADDFLAGRYGNLTTAEIEDFREAQSDPSGARWEREHAGEVMFLDEIDLNGFLFVEFPDRVPFNERLGILRGIVGPHPITPAVLWLVSKKNLIEKELKND